MADTPRSLATLLTLLADNTSGDITAQLIRDLTVSLYPSRGQLDLASGGAVATTFTASGVYVPVAGTTVLDTDVCSSCVTMPANGQLRFVKAQAQVLLAQAMLEVLPAANNKRFTFTFAKNGIALTKSPYTAFYGNLSGNPVGVYLAQLVPIVQNDIITLVVKNDTDTSGVTASVLTLSGVGFMT